MRESLKKEIGEFMGFRFGNKLAENLITNLDAYIDQLLADLNCERESHEISRESDENWEKMYLATQEKLDKTRYLLDYLAPHGNKYTEEDIENLCKSRGYYDKTFKPRNI